MMQTAARYALRARGTMSAVPRRNMAIAATVKTAPDTSAIDFPAPSHVSVAGDAVDIARQLRVFYESAGSSIELSPEARAGILEDLVKRASAIPDTEITAEWVEANVTIPAKVTLGENPVFKSLQK
jgi:hypothetical protein